MPNCCATKVAGISGIVGVGSALTMAVFPLVACS
jgi:hypothetical protein